MMDVNRIWSKSPYVPVTFQVKSEIREFLDILNDHKVKYMLEIGTFQCGTAYLFYNLILPGGIFLTIDLEPQKRKMNYHTFCPNIRDAIFKIIVGNSHDDSVLKVVQDSLKGEMLDALFIDGDHSYEGVKKDFEMYSPLVRPDGIVAFHDIAPHKENLRCYVEKYYRSIKDTHQHMELIEDMKQGWAGIGVIYMGAR